MYESFTGRDAAVGRMNPLPQSVHLFPLILVNMLHYAPQVAQSENLPRAGGMGLKPGLGDSSGEGKGNQLQYSCLESHG